MIVDVIILSYCKDQSFFDLNTTCISSLLASEENIHFNITVIESNPAWETMGFNYDFKNVSVIQPREPFHYNRYLNIGLASAQQEFIVFSNNDVVFHAGWLSEILKIKKQHPSFRSFCPFDRTSPHLNWEKYNKKEFYPGYRVPVEFVGWCFVVERSVFEKTGPFDEQFDLYFQDNDFANTLKKYKIQHAMVPSSFVQHLGGRTTSAFDALHTDHYARNLAVYTSKWGSGSFFQKLARKLYLLLRPQ